MNTLPILCFFLLVLVAISRSQSVDYVNYSGDPQARETWCEIKINSPDLDGRSILIEIRKSGPTHTPYTEKIRDDFRGTDTLCHEMFEMYASVGHVYLDYLRYTVSADPGCEAIPRWITYLAFRSADGGDCIEFRQNCSGQIKTIGHAFFVIECGRADNGESVQMKEGWNIAPYVNPTKC